jgi:hypothetical protein
VWEWIAEPDKNGAAGLLPSLEGRLLAQAEPVSQQ